MALAARLKQFLGYYKVPFRVLNYDAALNRHQAIEKLHIPEEAVLQAVPLSDGIRRILAVLPFNRDLTIDPLNHYFQTEFKVLPPDVANQLFFDCESHHYPPFGEPYGFLMVLDEVSPSKKLYFDCGCQSALAEIDFEDFLYLMGPAHRLKISHKKLQAVEALRDTEETESKMHNNTFVPPENLKFPEFPLIARQILSLSRDSDGHKLLALFSQNELNSASFSLGFEACLNAAEIQTFWTHALYCAKLAHMLSFHVSKNLNISPELSYSLGLFHNFGWILFAHLFPPEFRLLNKWRRQNPDLPIDMLEKRLLGMGQGMRVVSLGHAQLGAWLMEHWGMPVAFSIISQAHHHLEYQGEYQAYVCLIQLTNQLLQRLGVGESKSAGKGKSQIVLNSKALENLGLSRSQLESSFELFTQSLQPLQEMARALSN